MTSRPETLARAAEAATGIAGSFLRPTDLPRGRRVAEFDKFSAPLGRQQHLATTRMVERFKGAEGAEITTARCRHAGTAGKP